MPTENPKDQKGIKMEGQQAQVSSKGTHAPKGQKSNENHGLPVCLIGAILGAILAHKLSNRPSNIHQQISREQDCKIMPKGFWNREEIDATSYEQAMHEFPAMKGVEMMKVFLFLNGCESSLKHHSVVQK